MTEKASKLTPESKAALGLGALVGAQYLRRRTRLPRLARRIAKLQPWRPENGPSNTVCLYVEKDGDDTVVTHTKEDTYGYGTETVITLSTASGASPEAVQEFYDHQGNIHQRRTFPGDLPVGELARVVRSAHYLQQNSLAANRRPA